MTTIGTGGMRTKDRLKAHGMTFDRVYDDEGGFMGVEVRNWQGNKIHKTRVLSAEACDEYLDCYEDGMI